MTRTGPIPGQLGLGLAVPEPAPAAPAPRSRPGVRYLRRGAADDCAACWADQHAAHVAGRTVPTRQRAVWVREEERDPTARGHHPPAGVSRIALCPKHKTDRQAADQLQYSTSSVLPYSGGPK